MSHAKSKENRKTIAINKKAKFDYFIEDKIEAGMVLEGWEVKSLRAGRVQLVDSYVIIKNNEAFLLGAIITPLNTISTHVKADPTRTRKLLLNRSQISKFIGATDQKGYTIVCTALYWSRHLIKVEIGLARGKANVDKRETIKEREWQIQKRRLLRQQNR